MRIVLAFHLDLNAANISIDKALSYDPMNWVLLVQKGKVALLNMDYCTHISFSEEPTVVEDLLSKILVT